MKIIYMGTPEPSAKIMQDILNANIEIVSVYTQPDKKVGRKNIMTPPPVKVLAEMNNIPVHQPERLREVDVIKEILNTPCDYIVVAIFGQMIPKEILDYKPCINIHTSLLPKYRGASPIQEALLNDDKETASTCILMDEGLDSGPIIKSNIVKIEKNEMFLDLFEKLTVESGKLIVDVLNNYDKYSHIKQIGIAQHCRKIKKEDGLIEFNDAKEIFNKYRAYTPWPGLFLDNGLKIKELEIESIEGNYKVGEILKINKDSIIVGCEKGSLKIIKVQPVSKQEMNVIGYVNGKRFKEKDILI